MGDIALNSEIGPDSTNLSRLTVDSALGNVSLDASTGRIVTSAPIIISGASIDINGVIDAQGADSPPDQTLTVTATQGALNIYGEITAAGGTVELAASAGTLTIASGSVTA